MNKKIYAISFIKSFSLTLLLSSIAYAAIFTNAFDMKKKYKDAGYYKECIYASQNKSLITNL